MEQCRTEPGVHVTRNPADDLGFAAKVIIKCSNCDGFSQDEYLSQRVGEPEKKKNAPFDVNVRATLAFRGVGCGHAAMKEWCGTMNMPAVLSKASFIEINNRLEDAATKTFKSISLQSREMIKAAYADVGIKEDKDGILDIAVSYDGTWQRRGHVSHNGAMEVEAAKNLWERSVEQHKLRYTTMLCDGDSKAFGAVNELKVYGDDVEIEKEDCINHVSKRMGTALREVVAVYKAQKKSISGKGKLTQIKMKKIQNYYGKALKDHAEETKLCQKRIMAILFHLSSTDTNPKHVHCPPGESSWCFWQRANAKGEEPGAHKEHEILPPDVGSRLVPIFQRLSDEKLIKRRARKKTES
eukprot:gene18474-biopygen15564